MHPTTRAAALAAALFSSVSLFAFDAAAHDDHRRTELFKPGVGFAAESPMAPVTSGTERPPLYTGLGEGTFPVTTSVPEAQAYFDQGLKLAWAFNHTEARRAFIEAQRLDPNAAMACWGEAFVLGQNINDGMRPEAIAPAFAALTPRDRARPGHDGEGTGADRGARRALLGRPGCRPRRAQPRLGRRDARGGKDLSRRCRHPGVVRRRADEPPALGLLGGRRRDAQGQRRRDRRDAGDGARDQSEASGGGASLHPRGRGLGHAGTGRSPMPTCSAARRRPPATSSTCRRTSMPASDATPIRSR